MKRILTSCLILFVTLCLAQIEQPAPQPGQLLPTLQPNSNQPLPVNINPQVNSVPSQPNPNQPFPFDGSANQPFPLFQPNPNQPIQPNPNQPFPIDGSANQPLALFQPDSNQPFQPNSNQPFPIDGSVNQPLPLFQPNSNPLPANINPEVQPNIYQPLPNNFNPEVNTLPYQPNPNPLPANINPEPQPNIYQPLSNNLNPEISLNPEVNPLPYQPNPLSQPLPRDLYPEGNPLPYQPNPSSHPEVDPSPLIQPSPEFFQPYPQVDEPNPVPVPQPEMNPSPEQFVPSPQPISSPQPQENPSNDIPFCNINNTVYQTQLDGPITGSFIVNSNISFLWTTRTDKSSWLWRTTDGGVTWIDQTPFLKNINNFKIPPLKVRVEYGGIYSFVASPVNSKKLFILGNNGNFWTTDDGGDNYTNYTLNYEFIQIIPHPTNDSWLLGINYAKGCWTSDFKDCMIVRFGQLSLVYELSYSQDSGRTWTTLLSYLGGPNAATWGEAGTNGSPAETIYALCDLTPPVNYEDSGTMTAIKSIDFFQTHTKLVNSSVALLYIKDNSSLLIGQIVNTKFQLLVSSDFGQTFSKPNFPFLLENSNPTSYAILDTTGGSVFIGVQKSQSDRVDLYVSDVVGNDFSLSTQQILKNPSDIAFRKLTGLTGVYLANHYVNESIPQSIITFNNGGTWQTIAPPKNSCTDCSLHLFGPTEGFEVDTAQDDLGIIVGIGNVGGRLVNSLNTANMYISKDAGLTWEQLYNGSWLYDLSSRGDQIYLLDMHNTTDSLIYTEDLGKSWLKCKFAQNPQQSYKVVSISSDLSGRNSSAWILTSWANGGGKNYTLFYVDFNSIDVLPPCTDEQYEKFNPSGPHDECVLGQNNLYYRKIPGEKCEVDPGKLAREIVLCNCTLNDYYCTYCFKKQDGLCVLDNTTVCTASDPTPPPNPCPPGTFYDGSPKYRRVVGTFCVNDIEGFLAPRKVPCPGQSSPEVIPSPIIQNPQIAPQPPARTPVRTPVPVMPPTNPPQSPQPQPQPNAIPQNQSNVDSPPDDFVAEALGIALACIVVVAIIVAVSVYFFQKYRHKHRTYETEELRDFPKRREIL